MEETWTSFTLGDSYELESLALEPALVDRYEGLRGINVSFVRLLEEFPHPVSCLWMNITQPVELFVVDDVRTTPCFSELPHSFVPLDSSRKACSFLNSARMCSGTRGCALFSSFNFMLMMFVTRARTNVLYLTWKEVPRQKGRGKQKIYALFVVVVNMTKYELIMNSSWNTNFIYGKGAISTPTEKIMCVHGEMLYFIWKIKTVLLCFINANIIR